LRSSLGLIDVGAVVADDSWYTNSATIAGDRFEDYLVKDVVTEIDENTARFVTGTHAAASHAGGPPMVALLYE
jgi:hypothetical protein